MSSMAFIRVTVWSSIRSEQRNLRLLVNTNLSFLQTFFVTLVLLTVRSSWHPSAQPVTCKDPLNTLHWPWQYCRKEAAVGNSELLLPVLGPHEAARRPKEKMKKKKKSTKNYYLFSKTESGRMRLWPLWSEKTDLKILRKFPIHRKKQQSTSVFMTEFGNILSTEVLHFLLTSQHHFLFIQLILGKLPFPPTFIFKIKSLLSG